MVEELIRDARQGKCVYITDLHAAFAGLGDEVADTLACVVEALDGPGARRIDLRLPRLDGLAGEERALVEAYLHAEVYNILSSLGGKSMGLYFDPGRKALGEVVRALPEVFGTGLGRAQRSGYGRSVNVLDRMIGAICPGAGAFAFHFGDIREAPRPAQPPRPDLDVVGFFRSRTAGLGGKAFLGIDVGGTDIKAVLVDDGKVVDYKEYDWFPASFLRSHQLVDPICLIVQVLQARLWLHRASLPQARREALLAVLAPALDKGARDAQMAQALSGLAAEAGGREGLGELPGLDGIGLCFPDVVVKDKIVGGEVYKTRGIRNNKAIDYEADFAELTDLDRRLGAWLGPGGRVRIINDGPMASFTAAVELAASPEASKVASGVFAHTLGTELGTGWVTEAGTIPDIPLEVYNYIIDLGSWPERAFEPDDLRSINNFNTGLPGTLQKYCSQSGVFRLALKYFPSERPDLFQELQDKGYVARRDGPGGPGWYVPTEPEDQRKAFLEHMMALPDREKDDTNYKIWREIGEYLGVTLLETRRILEPGSDERFLFGRLVKNPTCFRLLVEGGRRICPGAGFVVAGTGMANTPLMRELEGHPELTVAQFAQAIGAVYFANGG